MKIFVLFSLFVLGAFGADDSKVKPDLKGPVYNNTNQGFTLETLPSQTFTQGPGTTWQVDTPKETKPAYEVRQLSPQDADALDMYRRILAAMEAMIKERYATKDNPSTLVKVEFLEKKDGSSPEWVVITREVQPKGHDWSYPLTLPYNSDNTIILKQ